MKNVTSILKLRCRNMSQKLYYPASERNKVHILEVLKRYFDSYTPRHVLEISSGSGQHISYFAKNFPNFSFQPSEYDKSLFNSIKEYANETSTKNVKDPLEIDITTSHKSWNTDQLQYDYLININMIHITPLFCTKCLFENASQILKPEGLLITYGPYAFNGVITPQSNVSFNRNLKLQNTEWGLRDIKDLEKLASENKMKLECIHDLPANNKCLIWKKLVS